MTGTGLLKTLFTLIFGLIGTEISVSKVDHFCQYAENSRFSKSNLRSGPYGKLISLCNSTILVSKIVFLTWIGALLFRMKKKSKVWPNARSSLVQYQTIMDQKIIIFLFLLFDSCGPWKMLWNVGLDCLIWSRIKKMVLFLVKKVNIEKSVYLRVYKLHSNPCQSVRGCPKICQITKLYMGYRKSRQEVVWRKSIFYLRRKLGEVSL